ncbi:putative Protein giant-lens [Hypsibius exemplaris]|uniref:Uncharacterized protein n=1 Tax=Hypsibius exemplaris TaxID=2072580 RepID=A0A1W0WHL2_HYPEX|nr:putative Protein giant-lens [Hypsibius exemplaris]
MWLPVSSSLILFLASCQTFFAESRARFLPLLAYPAARNIIYANGNSESDLPLCATHAVCNRIENFSGKPKIHRLCRCPTSHPANLPVDATSHSCPSTLNDQDGHTITDDSKMYKICGPVEVFPTCRFFHDTAYTITTYPAQNRTQQVIRCVCPAESTTYILKWKQKHNAPNHKMTYHYACSPQTFLRCAKDEPCSLFVDSGTAVNKQAVCSCRQGSSCPTRVTESTVKLLTVDANLGATTYAAYCRQDDS